MTLTLWDKKFITNTMLFSQMTDDEKKYAFEAMNIYKNNFKKGDIILHSGDCTSILGLVLKGNINIVRNDIWGNSNILSNICTGHFFAETYAVLYDTPLLVDVVSNSDSSVAFLSMEALKNYSASVWKEKLLTNLLQIASRKNLILSNKSFHTSPKTIRRRLMSYLDFVSTQSQSSSFEIPFNRNQLAEYLNVERTALSKEIGKMNKEGIIKSNKNTFTIITTEK